MENKEELIFNKDFENFNDVSEFLKGIAHPVRICILKGLSERNGCNVNNMQHCLELPQSTVSTHLSKLRSMGAVKFERVGNEVIYKIADKRVIKILKILGVIYE